jgi:hypothetical protein
VMRHDQKCQPEWHVTVGMHYIVKAAYFSCLVACIPNR